MWKEILTVNSKIKVSKQIVSNITVKDTGKSIIKVSAKLNSNIQKLVKIITKLF